MPETSNSINCADSKTVEELYSELRPFALSKTEYITGSMDIAQDIVHDVFVKLWQKKLSFPSKRAMYSWVYASCHNAAIDFLRAKNRTSKLTTVMNIDDVQDPKNIQERLVNKRFLEGILSLISEREGVVLAYKAIDGLTIKEISELMNVSEKTVKRDLAEVQQKLDHLRSHLDE